MDCVIRPASKKDLVPIFKLIQEIAEFEKLSSEVKITAKDFEADGVSKDFKCFVAVKDDVVVGYALYFDVYSSFAGPKCYLEDIYLQPHFRGQGIGKQLYNAVCKEAFQTSVGLRLYVLDWNVIAQNFYKRLGAHSNKDKYGLHVYRFEKDALSKITNHCSTDINIRKASKDDASTIHKLTSEFAKYLKVIDHSRSLIDFTNDVFGDDSKYTLYLAEINDAPVGYCLYYPTYSTFQGKMLYLEELFVSSDYRHTGVGKALMSEVAKNVTNGPYSRLQFVAFHSDEPTIRFYKRLGVIDLTVEQGWLYYGHNKTNWKDVETVGL